MYFVFFLIFFLNFKLEKNSLIVLNDSLLRIYNFLCPTHLRRRRRLPTQLFFSDAPATRNDVAGTHRMNLKLKYFQLVLHSIKLLKHNHYNFKDTLQAKKIIRTQFWIYSQCIQTPVEYTIWFLWKKNNIKPSM